MVQQAVIEPDSAWSLPPPAGARVDVAVVMPIHKHPGLFPEAIHSVLTQQGGLGIRIVLVDDGCPMPETGETASAYAAACEGRVIHLRRANGGLSAARNTGIDFALAAWPGLEAIYLLDADNRIGPHFLERALDLLRASPPEIGWIYPDINDFGFAASYDNGGPYSLYFHLSDNYCEAGSLIRRELLERGIRFDETMRLGFEDWEFWLQAAEAGFRGRHLRHAGFQYRRRAESMLTDSERDRPEILAAMRRKHRALHAPRNLLALEHAEAPRYALVAEDGPARLTTDPQADGETLSGGACWRRFLEAMTADGRVQFPGFVAFTTAACCDLLRELGLLRWLLWAGETLLEKHQVVTVSLAPAEDDDRVGYREPVGEEADAVLARSVLLLMPSRLLFDSVESPDVEWLGSLTTPAPRPTIAAIELLVPPRCLRGRPDLFQARADFMMSELAKLRRLYREGDAGKAFWRERVILPRTRSHTLARDIAGVGPLSPLAARPGRPDIAFVVPLAEYGGVEKIVANYALVARARFWRPHLVVSNARTASILPEFREAFESVEFLGTGESPRWQDEKAYFGVPPWGWAVDGDHRPGLALLAGMSVVVSAQSVDAYSLMARLRRFGVRTVAHVQLDERDRHGRPLGQPHFMLPYEHAFDLVTMPSEDLRRWCIAFGMPAEKLVVIPNAPSYCSAPGIVERAMAERGRRPDGAPLRLLYAGRLDRQKGVERLVDLLRRTIAAPHRFQWRIHGSALVDAGAGIDLSPLAGLLEPPVHGAAALDALFAWADAIVLPSRYEGVPLTILEAARVGCIACATRVGAVDEIVTDGVDGLLVDPDGPDEAVADRLYAAVDRLQRDRQGLQRLAGAAAARAAQANWEDGMTDFFGRLDRLIDGAGR
jgi:glycosyltransferase involved in cell wall biosynthesis